MHQYRLPGQYQELFGYGTTHPCTTAARYYYCIFVLHINNKSRAMRSSLISVYLLFTVSAWHHRKYKSGISL